MTQNGRPMRALRALATTTAFERLTEEGVWRLAVRHGDPDSTWHRALATLVKRGLAIRTGPRGGYEWYITSTGRGVLDE